MHTFWLSNGSVKMTVRENSKPDITSHSTGLEKLFPDNKLNKDHDPESNM